MTLLSKTYSHGMPFWFRRAPENAEVQSLALFTHDARQLRALWWTSRAHPAPKVAVLLMHPRLDFSHHYAIPRAVEAGFGVLTANNRGGGSDLYIEHEEMVLDVAACVRHLVEWRNIDRVVLFGNSGGGSLMAYYQAQARLAPEDRLQRSPAGRPTQFSEATFRPADGLILVAAHRGQGRILLDHLDPSVVDESDPLSVDPDLDLYNPANGFREPPAWSRFEPEFLARYRAAQVERARRLDEIARASLTARGAATAEIRDEGFRARAAPDRRAVQRRQVAEPIMVIYRTMANPSSVDNSIDPSGRDYGSLLSERPDLMNYASFGLARICTPRSWLSTWSGLSSKADLLENAAGIAEPTLVVSAGRDREVLPGDALAILDALASSDKQLMTFESARHYFEPEPGERDAPEVESLMSEIVPWIAERFA